MSQCFTVSPYTYVYKQIPMSFGLLLLITLVYSLLLLAHNFCYSWSFMALLPMVLLPLFSKVFVVVVFNRHCDFSNLIPIVLVEQSSCSMIFELTACPWSVYI